MVLQCPKPSLVFHRGFEPDNSHNSSLFGHELGRRLRQEGPDAHVSPGGRFRSRRRRVHPAPRAGEGRGHSIRPIEGLPVVGARLGMEFLIRWSILLPIPRGDYLHSEREKKNVSISFRIFFAAAVFNHGFRFLSRQSTQNNAVCQSVKTIEFGEKYVKVCQITICFWLIFCYKIWRHCIFTGF